MGDRCAHNRRGVVPGSGNLRFLGFSAFRVAFLETCVFSGAAAVSRCSHTLTRFRRRAFADPASAGGPERTAIVDTVDDSDLRADLFNSGHAVALKKQMD